MTPVHFADPRWLPLVAAPGALLLLWAWQLWRRRDTVRRLARLRLGPARERLPLAGDLLFWLCLLLALGSTILALARPVVVVSAVRTGGVDLVILQDGSASMRVRDVEDDRWQRSMRFLRTLGEALRWEQDRLALALFASIATPQIRLTRDPNTFFFFLDHLDAEPPFRLQDAGTWDTNIERGIYWGLRLIEKDEEIRGPSQNGAAFVLLSDGQAWSGRVERSLARAQARGVPLYAIGVGTTAGGAIPEPRRSSNTVPLASALDRGSLSVLATAGGGRYFELDREPDAAIANAIIAAVRARAPSGGIAESTKDLYWRFLLAGGGFLLLAVLFLRERAALALVVAAAAAAGALL